MRLICSLALLAAAPAFAQPADDWTPYSASNDGTKMAYSPSRTVFDGARAFTWVTETPTAPRPIDSTPGSPAYARLMARVELDCSRNGFRYVSGVFFAQDGHQITSTDTGSQMSSVVPGSTAEVLLYRVCEPRKLAEAAPSRNIEVDRARCALSAQSFYAPMKQALLAQQPLPQPQQPLIGGTVIVAKTSRFEGLAKLAQMDGLNAQERDMTDKCLVANGWPAQ